MATKTPSRANPRRPDLLGGFSSLTLDPSPRLRRARHRLAPDRGTILADAWKVTGRALTAAMISVGRAFGSEIRAVRPRSSKRSGSS